MTIKNEIKEVLNTYYENYSIKRMKKQEIKKFHDPRRKRIINSVNLSPNLKKEIDQFYLKYYGKKIPYTWHKYFTSYTGKFDYKYFPELLYIPEFEHFMNMKKAYSNVYCDKNLLYKISLSSNVKMPKTLISSSCGIIFKDNVEITKNEAIDYLKNKGSVFAKPTIDSSSGRGCLLLDIKDGIDMNSKKSIEEIINNLGTDYVFQEVIKSHESIKRIYSYSCNTFRIISYRWKNNFYHCPIIMRIGQNYNYLDNAHAGGMFIGISDNGEMMDKAFTEFQDVYEEHPNTHLKFKGYKIPFIDKIINASIDMHKNMPQVGCINFDFTLDENGDPILIEANMQKGSIWLSEIAHGKNPFGNQTEEILQWLHKMEKLKFSERKKHMFGN